MPQPHANSSHTHHTTCAVWTLCACLCLAPCHAKTPASIEAVTSCGTAPSPSVGATSMTPHPCPCAAWRCVGSRFKAALSFWSCFPCQQLEHARIEFVSCACTVVLLCYCRVGPRVSGCHLLSSVPTVRHIAAPSRCTQGTMPCIYICILNVWDLCLAQGEARSKKGAEVVAHEAAIRHLTALGIINEASTAPSDPHTRWVRS